MKVTLQLKGTTASAVVLALEARKIQLEEELGEITQNLEQLKKLGEIPKPEQTETGRIKHGQTEMAVMNYLLTVASPYEASQEQLMQHLGTSPTSTYRALKKLEADNKIRRTDSGNWIIKTGPITLGH